MVPKYTKNLSKATKGCQKVNKGRFLNMQYIWQKKANFQCLLAFSSYRRHNMVPKYTENLSKATKVNKGRFLNMQYFWQKKLIFNVCWP